MQPAMGSAVAGGGQAAASSPRASSKQGKPFDACFSSEMKVTGLSCWWTMAAATASFLTEFGLLWQPEAVPTVIQAKWGLRLLAATPVMMMSTTITISCLVRRWSLR